MNLEIIRNHFQERIPILKDDLQEVMGIQNEHSLNQAISYLVSFGVIQRFENGIYYIASQNEKFTHLKPSLHHVINKKYLENYSGIRTGAYLLYKYKFTSQVSSFYEVLSNNVSPHTRSKKEYDNKVSVSYPKFPINKENIHYAEFIELVKNLHYSDLDDPNNKTTLKEVFEKLELNKEKLNYYSNYYNGKRYSKLRYYIKESIPDETS